MVKILFIVLFFSYICIKRINVFAEPIKKWKYLCLGIFFYTFSLMWSYKMYF